MLGVNEQVHDLRADGRGALVVTSIRLMALSAFITGFHAVGLQGDERPVAIEHTGDVYLIKTTSRTVVFRSHVAGWAEMS